MIKTILITSCLLLTGCGGTERFWTWLTGGLTSKCSEEGTKIIQSDSGITHARNIDGSFVPCGKGDYD